MPSPFPGMDPYLERADLWHPVHTRLIAALADAIEPLLPAHYYVSVEERASVGVAADPDRLPDVAVVSLGRPQAGAGGTAAAVDGGVGVLVAVPDVSRERYLEIRRVGPDERVVTVIEILSPGNKRPGRRRDEYLEKRGAVLTSRTSLVEIDLLRSGPRMPAEGAPAEYSYSFLVVRAHEYPHAVLVPLGLRSPFPLLPVPLGPEDEEPRVDFGAVVTWVYDRGRYAMRFDYSAPAEPPLEGEDAAWADGLLRERGLR